MTPTESLRNAILELAEFGRLTDDTHAALVDAVTDPDDSTELRFSAVEDRLAALEKGSSTKSTTSRKGS